MTKRYNVRAATGRKKDDGKSFYTNIGSAWEVKGGGFSISLDALPCRPTTRSTGSRRLLMFPADEVQAQAQAPFKSEGTLDDEVPF